jgi:polysaccharide biosynthesis protein PslG
MVDNGDAAKRLAILEFGWTTDNRANSPYKWHAVTEQQQADYLVGAFTWARENWRPWIGTMSAIYIASPTWTTDNEEYYWSITLPDGTVRPSYKALAAMPK